MNELPYECTCKVSEETKVRRFFEAGSREFQLCLAILDGYKLKGKIGDHVYEAVKVKREGTRIYVTFPEIKDVDWRRHRTLILFDLEGKPLYRRTRRKMGLILRGRKSLILEFTLGGA